MLQGKSIYVARASPLNLSHNSTRSITKLSHRKPIFGCPGSHNELNTPNILSKYSK